jgi:hypothetical protein
VLEASENPLSNSEDEEEEQQADALPEGTPPEKSKKKHKKGAKKKKAVAEFSEMEIGSDEEDIDSEIAARVTEAQVKAAMKGQQSQKKLSKKEKKAAAAASDMLNPMADSFDEGDFGEEGGEEEESGGWTIGFATGKKKTPIVSRFVRLRGNGREWALLVYKDSSSADGKPLHGLKVPHSIRATYCTQLG